MSIQLTALHGFLGQPSDWAGLEQSLSGLQFNWRTPEINHLKIPLSEVGAYLVEQELLLSPTPADSAVTEKWLVGYSMGGRLALEGLRQQSFLGQNIWDRFVFISTNPGLQIANDKEVRLQSDLQWSQALEQEQWSDFLQKWNGQEALKNSLEPQRLKHNYQKRDLRWQLEQWSLARQRDSHQLLAESTRPVLWISGELDKKFLLLSENVNGPCLKKAVVPHSGHRVIFDSREGLSKVIEDWL